MGKVLGRKWRPMRLINNMQKVQKKQNWPGNYRELPNDNPENSDGHHQS